MRAIQGSNLEAADNVGVGISFRLESSGNFSVVRIVEGCPSDGQGIEVGDKLISVNDQLVQGLTFEALAAVLSGPRGTRVALQFARRDYLLGKMQILNVETTRDGPRVGSAVKLRNQDKIWTSSEAPPNILSPLPPVESPILLAPARPTVLHDPSVFDDIDVTLTRVPLLGSPVPATMQAEVGIGVKFSMPDSDGYGIISDMYNGAAASNSGKVFPGDLIWKVDGVDMKGKAREEIITACAGPVGTRVQLTVLRRRGVEGAQASAAVDMSSYSIPPSPPQPTQLLEIQPAVHTIPTFPNLPGSKTVVLDRVVLPDQDPHGPSSGNVGIVWSRLAQQKDPSVQYLVTNGPAERSGQIRTGDRLHAVDGVPVDYRTPTQVFDMTAGPPNTKVALTFYEGEPQLTGSQRVVPSPLKRLEPEEKVVSRDSSQEMAYRVRLHKIYSLGQDGVFEAIVTWLVHVAIGISVFLFLAVHNYIDIDWNLTRNHFGDDQPQSLSGAYFYALSPMAIPFVLFLLSGIVFMGLSSGYGKMTAAYVFGKKSGLFCVAMWGNVFVAGSVVLLYLYLSDHDCCDWISSLDQGVLVVMAPATAGILVYFIWTGIEVATIRSPAVRRLRLEIHPISGLLRRSVLGLVFIAGEVLLWLKIDDRVDMSWWVASIGLHAFIVLALLFNLMGVIGDLGAKPSTPPPHLTLHIVGVIDSLAFELIAIMVVSRMAEMDWDNDIYSPICITGVVFLLAGHTLLLAWQVFRMCIVSPKKRMDPPESKWLTPKVTKVIDPRAPPKMNIQAIWAAPTKADTQIPYDSFKLEYVATPLGYSGIPEDYTKKELPWTSGWQGTDLCGVLEGLDQSGEYLLRVCGIWKANRQTSYGPIIYYKVPPSFAPPPPLQPQNLPDVQTVPLEIQPGAAQPVLTTPAVPPPVLASSPVPSPVLVQQPLWEEPALETMQYTTSPVIDILPPQDIQISIRDDNAEQAQAATQIPMSIPGPLLLKDLRLAGGGSPFMFGLFEWVPQKHFGANILDLQLLEAGDGSDGHDYTTVYAGLENNVRVYNLLPMSKYRMRLRAGDFENGDLKTVVERCVLPFETPSVQEVSSQGKPSPVVRASVYEGANGNLPSVRPSGGGRDTAQLQAQFEQRLKDLNRGLIGPAEPAGNTLINPLRPNHPQNSGDIAPRIHQTYDNARPTALFASQSRGANYETSYSPVFM